VEERRCLIWGEDKEAHLCFRATAVAVTEWAQHAAPLSAEEERQFAGWLGAGCRTHWLQDALTMTFVEEEGLEEEDWQDGRDVGYYARDGPLSNLSDVTRCDRPVPTSAERSYVGRTSSGTSRNEYLEAVDEMQRLVLTLRECQSLKRLPAELPGLDAQTQTDPETDALTASVPSPEPMTEADAPTLAQWLPDGTAGATLISSA